MPCVSRSNPHYKDTAEAVPVGGPRKVSTRKKVTEAGPEIPSSKGRGVPRKVPVRKKVTEAGPEIPSSKDGEVPRKVPMQKKVTEADPESPARGKQVHCRQTATPTAFPSH